MISNFHPSATFQAFGSSFFCSFLSGAVAEATVVADLVEAGAAALGAAKSAAKAAATPIGIAHSAASASHLRGCEPRPFFKFCCVMRDLVVCVKPSGNRTNSKIAGT